MPRTPWRFYDSAASLADALRASFAPPVAIVGVGNALRGDDAFGPAVIAALEPSDRLRLFDVQAVPESFLVPIASCGASAVLFVDAADLGETRACHGEARRAEPGRVALIGADRLAEVDVSTHAISLSLVAEALQALARESSHSRPKPGDERSESPGRRSSPDLPCALLAAQPADLTTPDRLSPPMIAAVQLASAALRAFASALSS